MRPSGGSSLSSELKEMAPILSVAGADFVFHMLVAGNYGYFRDELYYIVSGQHLQLGYVDFPGMIAYLAALMNVLAGDGLVAIHVIPALAGAALVFVSGMMARELGGKRWAQVLAAVATLVTAQLALASIFSMDILDALWWSVGSYILIRLTKREEPRLWVLFGLVTGLGLMTKLTIVFFLLALIVALVLTDARRNIRSRWFWTGAAVAFLFLLPYVAWNVMNGWPTVDFYIHHGGLNGSGPADFVVSQVVIANPAGLPLVIAGLYFLLRSPSGAPFRFLGVALVLLFFIFLFTDGKSYFYAPAYPVLVAAGAFAVERASRNRSWIRVGLLASLVVVGSLIAPLEMPMLPPVTFAKTYAPQSGLANAAAAQSGVGVFPQYLADRFGWDTMTATAAKVYDGLPASERQQACIFTENYGEASALTFLGKGYGLPPVISGHNNFFIWGPGLCSGQVLIVIGLSSADLSKSFGNVTQAGTIVCSYCMDYENNVPVYVATNPLVPATGLWSTVKLYQ